MKCKCYFYWFCGDSRVLKGTSKTAMIFFSVAVQTQPIENLIGHFRVRKTLTFKTRLSAKPFMWKNYFHINSFGLSLSLKQRFGSPSLGLVSMA